MGGTAGHLAHLYDNTELSFSKMKEILKAAAGGKLSVSEKTDGAQISLSFRDGKATYARNKTDLRNLGQDIRGLINREFAGGADVKNAYIKAFKAYEAAIKSFDPKTQEKLFQGGTVFYNAEIQGPAFSNVINYDKNVITIHPTGHKQVDPETGEVDTFNNPAAAKLLDSAIDQVEQKVSDTDFVLQRGAVAKLKALDGNDDLKIVLSRLNKIMTKAGVGDGETVEDYLRAVIYPQIQRRLPHISEQIHQLVMNNLLGKAKLIGPEGLPKGFPKETKKEISNIKKDASEMFKSAIEPIELAIHDFAVEMLKGMDSAYILNNKREQERLKNEMEKAISVIQSSSNEDAIKLLTQNLAKLKDVENIDTAIEGVVFEYDGQVYKFTGNFAPINQILGLFRYGRGNKIPAFMKQEQLEEIEDEQMGEGRVVAVIPGGFKPPHAGHYEMAEYFADKDYIEDVYVIISPKERAGHSADRRVVIDKDKSYRLWKLYAKGNPKIVPMISANASPVRAVYDFMEDLEHGDTMFLAMSEKDVGAKDTRFAKAQEWSDKKDLGVDVKFLSIPILAGGISGTRMREAVAEGNKKLFVNGLPTHLSPKEKDEAWKIAGGQEEINEDYQDRVKKGHEEMKKKIITTGGNQEEKAPYTEEPETKRSKSAPVGAGALEEATGDRYEQALEKFGEEKVNSYLYALKDWLDHSVPHKDIQTLKENKEILQFLNPMPEKPKWLLRGLYNLDEIPEPGQPVVYTSKIKSYSSWTESLIMAKKFCGGGVEWSGNSVILAVEGKSVSDDSIIIWPFRDEELLKICGNCREYKEEEEWVLDTSKKTLEVKGVSYCNVDMSNPDKEEKIKQGDKRLRRSLDEQESNKLKFIPTNDKSQKPLVVVDDDDEPEELEEMSAMGAGAVEGAPMNDDDKLTKRVYEHFIKIFATEEKKEWKDKQPGGLADKKKPEDFDQAQLEKGIKVEMEHTDDPQVAKEIAMDHLQEDPIYYDKLEKMEKGND